MISKIKSVSLKKFKSSLTLGVMAVIIASSGQMNTVFAVDYNAQIQALQNEINQYQAQADTLHSQANTLQNALNVISAEKNALQAEIDLNEAKVTQLKTDIITNEAKLERQKKSISKTIAQIYVNGTTSPIEMLASSKSVGEYVSEQEIRTSVRNQMKASMDEVKRLRKELDNQKIDVENILATQNTQKEQLIAKENEQANLVAQTRGEEEAYQAVANNLQAQKSAAESALAASLSSGSYKVSPAGYVNAGDVVGAIGSTGLSSGPHLHLEARRGGGVTDPGPYIKNQPINMPPGYISQVYGNPDGMYRSGYHPGTDYAINSGAPIYAIDSGNMYRGCSDQMLGTSNNAYGYVAIVEHSNGIISVYAHMSGGPASCNYNTYY
ncbi:peptidoglycan DD-metalloendopeptidase family protein [Pedobacter sp.]|nr:peptidoglycan DD-metalloendopeptidase family protein [Candidatus Saccharibacteria bacterium]